MATLLKESLQETQGTYRMDYGVFSNSIKSAYVCRETFHHDFYKKYLKCWDFFYRPFIPQKIETIVDVISFFENQLHVNEQIVVKPVCFVHDNNNYEAFHFEVSPFWQDPIRYNLLTLIIKNCPLKADIKSIEESSFRKTTPAIKFLLEGNIYFRKPTFNGWSRYFATVQNVDQYLSNIPPANNKVEVCFHDGWTKFSADFGNYRK